MLCTQFDAKVKIFRTDNGTEYMDNGSFAYLESNGIVHQTSCPYTSAQNQVGRKNRHLLEIARSLLFTMNLLKAYLGDAILVSAYLINRMPLNAFNFRSPLEVLLGKNSYTVPPKVFGRVCFVHIRTTGKLDQKALKYVFFRCFPTQKGYICYHLPFRKYFINMDITLREIEPYFNAIHSPLQRKNNDEEVLPNSSITLDDLVQRESSSGQEETSDQGEKVECLDKPDLRRCSRRDKVEKAIIQPTQFQKSSSLLSGESSSIPESINDLDRPIAQRKGVRSYTKHSISNFVFHDYLSLFYRTFVSSISFLSIPHSTRFTRLEGNPWRS